MRPTKWTRLLLGATWLTWSVLCLGCAATKPTSQVLYQDERVFKIVNLPTGYAACDGRGDSIALSGARLSELEGWYCLAPGTLAVLYRHRVTTDTP